MHTWTAYAKRSAVFLGSALVAIACAQPIAREMSAETLERATIAAASLEDAVVVDCQLPGSLQKLGGTRTYLNPGRLTRLAAVDCRARGGEYTLGDLSSGTLSLARWLPLAQKGDAEAQYYVARIYANGMSDVDVDYAMAAEWYQRAVDQGYASAQQELGYLYEQGLGVKQDLLLALDLQRKGSGLGEELDYAWKITAAKEEVAKQVAELSQRLEESNGDLEDLRAQFSQERDALLASRSQLAKSEDAVLDLRAQLDVAKTTGAGADAVRVSELQKSLAAREEGLRASQQRIEALEAELAGRQEQLSASLAKSQVTSLKLNELLASNKEETKALRGQLAQAQQRLINSQQELGELRAQYKRDVDRLAQERDELNLARKSAEDGDASLLAAKQRELARQQLRVQTLEAELANAKRGQTGATEAAAAASEAAERNAALRRTVGELQARLDGQMKQLRTQEQEMAALRSQSQQDRVAALQKLSDQLAARNAELVSKQRRLASLESESGMLRDEVKRLRDQHRLVDVNRAGENQRLQDALQLQRTELAEQRERLEQLETEAAIERSAKMQAQDRLREMEQGRLASQREISILKGDIKQREQTIQAKEEFIAELKQQLSAPVLMAGLTQRSPQPKPASDSDPDAAKLLALARSSNEVRSGHYHALVIGNQNYALINRLSTPLNDARSVSDLLEQRYNFKVTLLEDATKGQIMTTLHNVARILTEEDSLLIYYAGHGEFEADAPGRAYWLGVDANQDTRDGYLETEQIRSKIKQMRAKHVLLVADSCFSGAITHAKTTTVGRGINEQRFRILWDKRARLVLASGQLTPVVDNAGDRNHSLFATYFIQILRQNNFVMSGEMLSHELNARIQPAATKLNLNQKPTYSALHDADHKSGDFFFVPVPMQLAAL